MSSPNAPAAAEARSSHEREAFSSRTVFILAAMGSAIGLGNIWRFPYIAYENGGGAFMVPYLVALLSAGLPLLMLDYAVGHRFRASAPLAFRRLHPKAEVLGWWQLAICCVIAVYYAAILAWAGSYTIFSFTKAWGDDPEGFLMGQYLQVAETVAPSFDFVPQVLIGMVVVWVVLIAVMSLGVQKGIGRFNVIFLPLLIVMFIVMVVISLTLEGAGMGLDALFTPDWSALSSPSVWMAAYGQIFFSLSVGFGIMVTYASYLKPKTDLTSSALVVGFANSSFEILAGIGVFAALGFMAGASGVAVGDVATNGIGLAFIAFPTIISQAPAGTLIGVLFFGALTFAGFTSLISIVEVVIAGFQDKLGLTRIPAVLIVTIPLALVSLALFPTTTGLSLLDVADAFVNNYGIMLVALVAVVLLTAGLTALPVLRDHLNSVSSFKLGRTWMLLVGGLGVVVLGYSLVGQLATTLSEGYGGYPSWYVNVFGWGMALALPVLAWLMTLIPWSAASRASQSSPAPPILDSVLDRRLLETTGRTPLHDGSQGPWADRAEPSTRTEIPAETQEATR